MEDLAQAPANADNTASVEATQTDVEVAQPEGADPAPAAAETGKPERDKVQERFDQLTREKYEGLSRAERAEYRAQLLEQQLEELRKAPAKPETVAPSNDYPTLESVGWDEEKHRAAVAAWVKNQTSESVKSVLEQERIAREREQSARDWTRKEQAFIEKNPDYVQKVIEAGKRGEWVCSPDMAQVIQQSDIGPEIAAYLAENASKSFEIARLPSYLQAREIGRIEERLAVAKTAPPPVSKAPAPPSRVDTSEAAQTVRVDSADADTLSDAEWTRRRNLQEQARLRKLRGG